MSGVSITVDDQVVLKALLAIAKADLHPAMEAIGAHLVTSTQQRFEKETGPDGQRWARLKPRTAARRIGKGRRGFDNILRVSGRLSSSITHVAGPDNVRVGTNVAYAAIQQLGGKIEMGARRQTIYQRYDEKTGDLKGFVKRRASNFARDVDVKAHSITIPARPYLGVDDADRAEILAILSGYLGQTAGEAQP